MEFGGAVVRVKKRGDGLWVARWREHGKGRNTTSPLKESILKLAQKKAKELGGKVGGKVVTFEDAELVATVKRIAGQRPPLVWLQEVEDAQRRLQGKTSLKQAVDYYEGAGMLEVKRVSFVDARRDFMARYDEGSRDTWSSYRKCFAKFEVMHEGVMVCDITEEVLAGWLEARAPGASSTWNKQLGYWKTFLNWCRKKKWLPKGELHAAELVEREKEGDRIPPIFTPEIAAAALRALPAYLVPTFIVGCWLGARPRAELRKLAWEHFDWERCYVELTVPVAGKTMRHRFTPIPENVVRMLKPAAQWLKGQVSGRQHLERISQILREKKVIEVWPPDVMRHSYISYQIALGKGFGQVAEWAGTSERRIRKNYRRPLRKEDGEAWFAVVVELDAEQLVHGISLARSEGAKRSWVERRKQA